MLKALRRIEHVVRPEYKEGPVTSLIESQTAKIPSGVYLSLAIGSMAASLGLAAFSKQKYLANFIGLWVPSILLMGLYNKIVKIERSTQS